MVILGSGIKKQEIRKLGTRIIGKPHILLLMMTLDTVEYVSLNLIGSTRLMNIFINGFEK